ncbi:hypothetical protein [Nostoc sp. CHAB 5715]|nr:hypothetical protein [Nostoc sp. CHAB 5715]MCC5623845.1 hypothetical protein [Nostoc sp. CHAB 5715]
MNHTIPISLISLISLILWSKYLKTAVRIPDLEYAIAIDTFSAATC